MKWFSVITAFAILACSGFANDKKNKTVQEIKSTYSSVAVLELFTSEGCSSCPGADRLLPQLASLDSNIVALSFHVDYWNYIGWKDPFSSAAFSDRQRKYGEQFHLESIYTPQLIINGQYELVGSNRSVAETDIKKALQEKAAVQFHTDEMKRTGNTISISCSLSGEWKGTDIKAALVQKHAEVDVKAGENKGAKLSHINIVRSFAQKPAQQSMQFDLNLPTGIGDDNWQVILYAQKADQKITGAVTSSPTPAR